MTDREPTREQLIQELAEARRRIGDMEAIQARLEDRLRESEERFRTAFEQAGVGMAHVSRQGRFMLVNDPLGELLGYTKEELCGKTMAEVTHPEDREASTSNAERLLRGEIAGYDMEKRYLRKDGSVVWVHLTASPVRKASGEAAYFIKVVEDITEERQVQAALHRSQALLDKVLDAMPVGVFVADEHGGIARMNPAAEQLWCGRRHAPREQLDVYKGWWAGSGKRIEAHDWAFARAFERGETSLGEIIDIECFDGSRKTIRNSAVPVRDDSGRIISAIAVNEDITEERRIQEELRQARDEAQRANRAKSDFLANMSHEIRTPLNGIIGMAELAHTRCQEPRICEYIGMMRSSADHLLSIVNDILDLSRIEAGRLELTEADFDLHRMLDSVLDTLTPAARRQGIALRDHVSPSAPTVLRGDEGRLKQVLINLLDNAIKFTDQGAVTLRVRLADSGAPCTGDRPGGLCLLFEVQDTGIGIPPDKLGAVFENFMQVGDSLTARREGSGLGLAISKNLVERMGGVIWAESEPGRGSTFSFTVVLAPGRAPRLKPEQPLERRVSARPLAILLAEDNPINTLVAVALLEEQGHKVTAVGNGREALEALAREPFDMVLMDIRMPELDGEETTRIIRHEPPPGVDRDVPIIALTAYALKGDRERFLAAGMDDYISKPFDMQEFNQVLERIRERSNGRAREA